MKEIPANHIITPHSSNGWFGFNYNMNIYRGCCHGCIYCDSRSNCYNIENFDEVAIKADALKILQSDLKSKRKKGVIGTGSMTDHYNPFEKQLEITRGALKLIDSYGFGIGITTKSDLVKRDKDILASVANHSPAFVNFTITTIDDKLCRIIEPYSQVASQRFKAMKELSDNGVTTGIMLTPILPFINDSADNISAILQQATESGAKYAFTFCGFGVTLRDKQRDYYYAALDKHFPSLKQRYIKCYGDTYLCASQNSNVLWKIFVSKCNELNLKYKMDDIINLIKGKYEKTQLSFLE